MGVRRQSALRTGWSSTRALGSLLLSAGLLLVVAAPASGVPVEEPSPPPHSPSSRLQLFWADPHELLERKLPYWGRGAVEKEIETLFRQIGVAVTWEDARDTNMVAVRVVLLPIYPERWRLRRRTMGAVIRPLSSVPVVYVFFPSVVLSVGGAEGNPRLWHPRKARPLVRALARVVAHEIVHGIAPEIPHDSGESVLSADLPPRTLRCERLSFSEETAAAIQARLAAASRDEAGRPQQSSTRRFKR